MAKETIILEYQLVPKGGDKIVSTVTEITEAWDKSGKAATAALSEKQIDNATAKLEKFNVEVEKTSQGFTSAKGELNALTKQITSGQLQGNDLKVAVKRAAELKDRIGDVRSEINKLSSDTRIFDTFVEGGRAVAAAFSVAQGAAALFGEENKDLQKSILKVQGALALLTGAQELANIVTTKGGIATKAYGVALKVVEGIQKAFAISAAASWAIATAGISLLVAGVAYLASSYSSVSEETQKATEAQKEFNKELAEGAEAARTAAANKKIALGQITQYEIDRQKIIKDSQDKIDTLYSRVDAQAEKEGLSHDQWVAKRRELDPIVLQIEQTRNDQLETLQLSYLSDLADNEATSQNKRTAIAIKAEEERRKLLGITMKAQIKEMRETDRLLETSLFDSRDKVKEFVDYIANSPEVDMPPLITEKDVDDSKANGDQMAADAAAIYRKGVEDAKKANEEKKQLQDAYFSFASQAATSLQSIINSSYQQDTQNLEIQKQKQLQVVGDNTKAREAIEKRFAKKQAEIAHKQAIANKVFSIFQIGLSTAQAVVNALGAVPYTPANIALAAIAGAIGAAQLAAAAAAPIPAIPQYGKGGMIDGKPHSRGGVIIEAEGGEFINNTKSTKKYSEELQAANDLQLEDLIYHKYLLPALKQAGAADKEGNLYDDWLLRREVKASRNADRENSKYIVSGILTGMREQNYLQKRYFS